MYLLYLAPVCIDKEKPDGVGKKILNHLAVFSKYFRTVLLYYGKDGIVLLKDGMESIVPYNGRHRRFALYEEAASIYKEKKIDYTYIRYPKSEGKFIELLRVMNISGSKIVVEIPTYPYNGNLKDGIKTIVVALIDAYYRRKLKKYVNRIVTFSDDKSIFGIPTIRTINGIVFDTVRIAEHKEENKVIRLISVATNYECHGFDRIIRGLEKYYTNNQNVKVEFHIVGDGPAIETYKKLLLVCPNAQNYVFLEGFMAGEKLIEQYNYADIAVNSLALYRLGLKKESTLKTKEYAAKGLPIISSTEVDAFNNLDNEKYVLLVPDCGDPIEIERIVRFYQKIYNNTTHGIVASQIREAAKKICDMQVTLKNVIAYFKEQG